MRVKRAAWWCGMPVLALLLVLSTGCGGAQPRQEANGPATTGQPKVSRVVMGLQPPSTETNEPRHVGSPDSWQLRPQYEYLIGLDEQSGRLTPQLATAWKIDASAKAIIFTLRKGVQFHQGAGEFTAKDVQHSFKNRIQTDSLRAVSYLKDTIKDIQVYRDYEAVVQLTTLDIAIMEALSEVEGGMEIQSKAHADKVGEPGLPMAVAGTGPYQFLERSQGDFVRFQRVPFQHWRATPDFPEFEFRFQKEASTRLAALLTGEVHLTTLPNDLLPQALSRGNKTVQGHAPGFRTFFAFVCCYWDEKTKTWANPESPLLDVRVRRALDKAIDRPALNKAFFGDKGETMYLSHFHPTWPGWNPDWQAKFLDESGYDTAKARALLNDAGYGPGKPLTTNFFVPQSAAGVPTAGDLVEAVAGYWRAIGVNVNLLTVDGAQITAGKRVKKWDNHIALGTSSATQFTGFSAYNSEAVVFRGHGMDHPDTEAIFRQVVSELDDQKRTELWRKLGDTAYPLHLSIPLFWLPSEAVINPQVVADYSFPGGAITGTWTHVQNIRAAR